LLACMPTSVFGTRTVMAGPITAVRYWRARGIEPGEAQFEAQTRFRPGAGFDGENGPLQRREECGENFKRPWTHVAKIPKREEKPWWQGWLEEFQMTRDDRG
jgi:hypothetical protein